MKHVKVDEIFAQNILLISLLTNQTECSWRLSLLCTALEDMSDTNLANQE